MTPDGAYARFARNALLRALLGAALGLGLGVIGSLLGFPRAAGAPPDAPPQVVLQTGGASIVIRYTMGYLICGMLFGILWPMRRRARPWQALYGALVGTVFALFVSPAMEAALPNWPASAPTANGDSLWWIYALSGFVAGGLLGWSFPITARRGAAAEGARPTI